MSNKLEQNQISSEEFINNSIHMIKQNLGTYLKDERTKSNLTIRDLAKRSHVSTAVITDAENFRSLPRTEVLIKLAYALDISLEALFEHMCSSTFNKQGKSTKQATVTIDDVIAREGLSKIDTRDVIKYIEFLKYKARK